MIPLQTSFEEYLFRGYFMQGLGTLVKNRWVPLIITSVCFGGLHFFNPEVTQMGNLIMIYYIGTGFLLGIMTLMDEGMELALGFHAGNNLTAALLVTADWTAFQTESIFKDISDPTAGIDVLVPVFIIYPLFLFIMAKKYGWSDWKNKLFGKVEKPETIKLSEES
jgi:membrane protease YdiL (CAAX protease family)